MRKKISWFVLNFRLCGIDPVLSGFYPEVLTTHVSSKDAKFVDIIHADAGFHGTLMQCGHADFWPNNGKSIQPGGKEGNFESLSPNGMNNSFKYYLKLNINKIVLFVNRALQS